MARRNPFRDRELAEESRRAREAEDAQLAKEEDAARRKQFLEWSAKRTFAGGGILFVILFFVVRMFGVFKDREANEARMRPVVEAVAAAKPKLVVVDQGGVRPSPAAFVKPADVRGIVDRHADELAKCFDDGLASGELELGSGSSHAFAFSWTIAADGTMTRARIETGGAPRESTALEKCVLATLSTWTFGDVGAEVDVIAWRFERCPQSREECVRPKG